MAAVGGYNRVDMIKQSMAELEREIPNGQDARIRELFNTIQESLRELPQENRIRKMVAFTLNERFQAIIDRVAATAQKHLLPPTITEKQISNNQFSRKVEEAGKSLYETFHGTREEGAALGLLSILSKATNPEARLQLRTAITDSITKYARSSTDPAQSAIIQGNQGRILNSLKDVYEEGKDPKDILNDRETIKAWAEFLQFVSCETIPADASKITGLVQTLSQAEQAKVSQDLAFFLPLSRAFKIKLMLVPQIDTIQGQSPVDTKTIDSKGAITSAQMTQDEILQSDSVILSRNGDKYDVIANKYTPPVHAQVPPASAPAVQPATPPRPAPAAAPSGYVVGSAPALQDASTASVPARPVAARPLPATPDAVGQAQVRQAGEGAATTTQRAGSVVVDEHGVLQTGHWVRRNASIRSGEVQSAPTAPSQAVSPEQPVVAGGSGTAPAVPVAGAGHATAPTGDVTAQPEQVGTSRGTEFARPSSAAGAATAPQVLNPKLVSKPLDIFVYSERAEYFESVSREYRQKMAAKIAPNFYVRKIDRDEHCLFRAIAAGLLQTTPKEELGAKMREVLDQFGDNVSEGCKQKIYKSLESFSDNNVDESVTTIMQNDEYSEAWVQLLRKVAMSWYEKGNGNIKAPNAASYNAILEGQVLDWYLLQQKRASDAGLPPQGVPTEISAEEIKVYRDAMTSEDGKEFGGRAEFLALGKIFDKEITAIDTDKDSSKPLPVFKKSDIYLIQQGLHFDGGKPKNPVDTFAAAEPTTAAEAAQPARADAVAAESGAMPPVFPTSAPVAQAGATRPAETGQPIAAPVVAGAPGTASAAGVPAGTVAGTTRAAAQPGQGGARIETGVVQPSSAAGAAAALPVINPKLVSPLWNLSDPSIIRTYLTSVQEDFRTGVTEKIAPKFNVRKTEGDGHCLFRAVATGLLSTCTKKELTRKIKVILADDPCQKIVLESLNYLSGDDSVTNIMQNQRYANAWIEFLRKASINWCEQHADDQHENGMTYKELLQNQVDALFAKRNLTSNDLENYKRKVASFDVSDTAPLFGAEVEYLALGKIFDKKIVCIHLDAVNLLIQRERENAEALRRHDALAFEELPEAIPERLNKKDIHVMLYAAHYDSLYPK